MADLALRIVQVAKQASAGDAGAHATRVFMPVSIAAALLEVLRRPVPKWLTWTGIVSAFCVAAYTGFLLGVVSAYPLWNNAILQGHRPRR